MAVTETRIELLMKSSYLDTNYELNQQWTVSRVIDIENPNFKAEYELKRMQLTQLGRNDSETIDRCVFGICSQWDQVTGVMMGGITVAPSNNNSQVFNSKGVILYRNADILLKSASFLHRERFWLIICKAMFGRAYRFFPISDDNREPELWADSHVSCGASLNDSITVQALKSQVFLYETDTSSATGFTSRPRHCLPFACIELTAASCSSSMNLLTNFVDSSVRLVLTSPRVPPSTSIPVFQSRGITTQCQGNRLPVASNNECRFSLPVVNCETRSINNCDSIFSASNLASRSVAMTLVEPVNLIRAHRQLVLSLIRAFVDEMQRTVSAVLQLNNIVSISDPVQRSLATLFRIKNNFQGLSEKCKQYSSYLKMINTKDPRVQLASIDVLQHNVNEMRHCVKVLFEIFTELHRWNTATPSVFSGLALSNVLLQKEPVILNQIEAFGTSLSDVIRFLPASNSSSHAAPPIVMPVSLVVADGVSLPVQNDIPEWRQSSEISLNDPTQLVCCERGLQQPIVIQPDGMDDDEAPLHVNLQASIKTESLSERRHRISNEPFEAIILDFEDIIVDADMSESEEKCQEADVTPVQSTNHEASPVKSIGVAPDKHHSGDDEKVLSAINEHRNVLEMKRDDDHSTSSGNDRPENIPIEIDKTSDVTTDIIHANNQNANRTVSLGTSRTCDISSVLVGDFIVSERRISLSSEISCPVSEASSALATVEDDKVNETVGAGAVENAVTGVCNIVDFSSKNGKTELDFSDSNPCVILPSCNSVGDLSSCVPEDSFVSAGDTLTHIISKEEPLSLVVSANQRPSLFFELDCVNKIEPKYQIGIDHEDMCEPLSDNKSVDVDVSVDQTINTAVNQSTFQLNPVNSFDDNISSLIASVIGVVESKPETRLVSPASIEPITSISHSENLPRISDTDMTSGETGRNDGLEQVSAESTCIKQDLDACSYGDTVLEDSSLFKISSVCSVKCEPHDGPNVPVNTLDEDSGKKFEETDEIIRSIRALNYEQQIAFEIRDDSSCLEANSGVVVKQEVVDDDAIGSYTSLLHSDSEIDFESNSGTIVMKAESFAISDELNLSKTIEAIRGLVAQSAFHSAATANFANLNTVAKGKKRKKVKCLPLAKNKKLRSSAGEPTVVFETGSNGAKKSKGNLESHSEDAIGDEQQNERCLTSQEDVLSSPLASGSKNATSADAHRRAVVRGSRALHQEKSRSKRLESIALKTPLIIMGWMKMLWSLMVKHSRQMKF